MLHAQQLTAEYLHGRGAHYLLTVKPNQPGRYARLTGLPWTEGPVADRTRDRGHDRAATRPVKVTAAPAAAALPAPR